MSQVVRSQQTTCGTGFPHRWSQRTASKTTVQHRVSATRTACTSMCDLSPRRLKHTPYDTAPTRRRAEAVQVEGAGVPCGVGEALRSVGPAEAEGGGVGLGEGRGGICCHAGATGTTGTLRVSAAT